MDDTIFSNFPDMDGEFEAGNNKNTGGKQKLPLPPGFELPPRMNVLASSTDLLGMIKTVLGLINTTQGDLSGLMSSLDDNNLELEDALDPEELSKIFNKTFNPSESNDSSISDSSDSLDSFTEVEEDKPQPTLHPGLSGNIISLKNSLKVMDSQAIVGDDFNVGEKLIEIFGTEPFSTDKFVEYELNIDTDASGLETFLGKFTTAKIIYSNEEYALVELKTEDVDDASCIAALTLKVDEEGEDPENLDLLVYMYFPRFGNTIAINKGDFNLPNRKLNPEFFNEDGSLLIKYSLEKIISECNFKFYRNNLEDTGDVLVSDFGSILQSKILASNFSSKIDCGYIFKSDSPKEKQFIKDFEHILPPLGSNEKKFKFFIKLKQVYSTQIINELSEIISCIDLDKSELIANSPVHACREGIYVELDLETLADNILGWVR